MLQHGHLIALPAHECIQGAELLAKSGCVGLSTSPPNLTSCEPSLRARARVYNAQRRKVKVRGSVLATPAARSVDHDRQQVDSKDARHPHGTTC